MKIMLVQPNRSHGKLKTSHPHMGIASLAAYCLQKGHDTFAIDAMYECINNETVLNRIAACKPHVLGLTAKTPDIYECEKIAKCVKDVHPNTVIVIGGAHITALRDRVLDECPYFDYGVYGEGELTFSELLDQIDANTTRYSGINGLIFREDDSIRVNSARPFMLDLDNLLFPAWHLFPQGTDIPLFTSRGCPFKCIFCQRVMGSKVRVMSPERIVEDMQRSIRDYNTRFFQIEDETFGINKKWTAQLMDLIVLKGISRKVGWAANSRVNIANFDSYIHMKEAGCKLLGFGIESGNQQILDSVSKGFELQKAIKAIDVAKNAGIKTSAFFILGHPNETPKTVRDTIDFACMLNPDMISFGIMVPYPGTKIFELAKANEGGYRNLSGNWSAYTKYFGNAMEFANFRKGQLQRFQKQAYLEFYIRTLRFGKVFRTIGKYLRKQS